MIDKITLQNFRNYANSEFEVGKKTIIVGENGSGKSNLLEAMYMMAIGKSKRVGIETEMIRYGETFSIVTAQCSGNDLKITLTDGIVGSRKRFEVNEVPRRMVDFVGKLRAVEFSPMDMELITDSPALRRRYLDFVLAQVDREYHRCLVSYEKGLRQRNKILDNIREGFANRQQLFFWDRLLIKNGEYITLTRDNYLKRLSDKVIESVSFKVEYDKSVISESRLAQYEVEEVAAAATLVGPHRDDFVVNYSTSPPLLSLRGGNLRDVAKYGSRGEQRMAVLWLKLGERDFLIKEAELPVLLFDDIFSELDDKHKREVLKLVDDQVERGGQVIMTTADTGLISHGKKWKVIRL